MKIPTILKDYEVSFLKMRGLLVTQYKYSNQEEFNKSILIYSYIPTFGVFLLDEEDNKQYKLTGKDIPDWFSTDLGDWFKIDFSTK